MAALRRVDASVRHDRDVCVIVSGRIEGRAANGMADTIRRRMVRQDELLDDTLEPLADSLARIQARRRLRRAWIQANTRADATAALARRLGVDATALQRWLVSPYFGDAWAQAEADSPALARRPVRRADVRTQLRAAEEVLRQIENASLSSTGQADAGRG